MGQGSSCSRAATSPGFASPTAFNIPPANSATRGAGWPRRGSGVTALVTMPPRASRSTTPSTSDRKSTRLNSSHSQIPYAVFCLKKNAREAAAREVVAEAQPPHQRGELERLQRAASQGADLRALRGEHALAFQAQAGVEPEAVRELPRILRIGRRRPLVRAGGRGGSEQVAAGIARG